jgi:hypothetical protein
MRKSLTQLRQLVRPQDTCELWRLLIQRISAATTLQVEIFDTTKRVSVRESWNLPRFDWETCNELGCPRLIVLMCVDRHVATVARRVAVPLPQ